MQEGHGKLSKGILIFLVSQDNVPALKSNVVVQTVRVLGFNLVKHSYLFTTCLFLIKKIRKVENVTRGDLACRVRYNAPLSNICHGKLDRSKVNLISLTKITVKT